MEGNVAKKLEKSGNFYCNIKKLVVQWDEKNV
jgi:hypothetical protein